MTLNIPMKGQSDPQKVRSIGNTDMVSHVPSSCMLGMYQQLAAIVGSQCHDI